MRIGGQVQVGQSGEQVEAAVEVGFRGRGSFVDRKGLRGDNGTVVIDGVIVTLTVMSVSFGGIFDSIDETVQEVLAVVVRVAERAVGVDR